MKILLIVLLTAGVACISLGQSLQKSARNPIYKLLDSCRKLDDTETSDRLIRIAKHGYQLSLHMKNDSLATAFCAYIGAGFEESGKLDSALSYYRLSKQYALKINNGNLIILALKDLVNAYEAKGMSDSVYANVNAVESRLPTVKDKKIIDQVTSMLGATYTAHNNYEKAISNYIKNIKYNTEIGDDTRIGMALLNIGNCYLQMSNNKKALFYFKDALPHLNRYARAKIICESNLGVTFGNMGLTDSAVKYFRSGRSLASKKKDSVDFSDIGGKLALALIDKKQFAEAKVLVMASLAYGLRTKNVVAITDAYTFLGNLNHTQGSYDLSSKNFKTALKIAQGSRYAERQTQLYGLLAENEASAKRFREAFNYGKRFKAENDSLTSASSKSSIAELESSYQNQKKQQQIDVLVHKQKEKEAQLLVQTRTKYFLLAGLFFVIAIVGLIWRAYYFKQEANKIFESKNIELEEKNVQLAQLNGKLDEANRSKSKLFSILSHDLRAPINSVFQYISLQKSFPNKLNEIDQKKHGEKILNSADNLLSSMEDLLIWSKSQMDSFALNHQLINAKEIVDDVYALSEDFAESRIITLNLCSRDDIFLQTDVNFLKIVIRNIVGNSIKFTSPGGQVDVRIEKEKEWINFFIEDNGKGMTAAQVDNVFEWTSIRSDSSGLGLKLAKEFTERLGGQISVKSGVDQGTTFTVCVPSNMVISNSAPETSETKQL